MQKIAPTPPASSPRLVALRAVVSAALCLWLSFRLHRPSQVRRALPLPCRLPRGHAGLGAEAAVRISCVDVGKVRAKQARPAPAPDAGDEARSTTSTRRSPRTLRRSCVEDARARDLRRADAGILDGSYALSDGARLPRRAGQAPSSPYDILDTFDRAAAALRSGSRTAGGAVMGRRRGPQRLPRGRLPSVSCENGILPPARPRHRPARPEGALQNSGVVFDALSVARGASCTTSSSNTHDVFGETRCSADSPLVDLQWSSRLLDESRADLPPHRGLRRRRPPVVRLRSAADAQLGPTVPTCASLARPFERTFAGVRRLILVAQRGFRPSATS